MLHLDNTEKLYTGPKTLHFPLYNHNSVVYFSLHIFYFLSKNLPGGPLALPLRPVKYHILSKVCTDAFQDTYHSCP